MIAPKPGWFRIVFSSVDSQTLDEALKRIGSALEEEPPRKQIKLLSNDVSSNTNGCEINHHDRDIVATQLSE